MCCIALFVLDCADALRSVCVTVATNDTGITGMCEVGSSAVFGLLTAWFERLGVTGSATFPDFVASI